jgi:hypothetical protein
MEKTGRQTFAGYQMHSLIEFLLGDDTRPGWLETQSHSQFSSSSSMLRDDCASRLARGSAAA